MGSPGGDMEMWLISKTHYVPFQRYILCQIFLKNYFLKMRLQCHPRAKFVDVAPIWHKCHIFPFPSELPREGIVGVRGKRWGTELKWTAVLSIGKTMWSKLGNAHLLVQSTSVEMTFPLAAHVWGNFTICTKCNQVLTPGNRKTSWTPKFVTLRDN